MLITRRNMTMGLAASGLVIGAPRVLAQAPMKLTLAHNSPPPARRAWARPSSPNWWPPRAAARSPCTSRPPSSSATRTPTWRALRTERWISAASARARCCRSCPRSRRSACRSCFPTCPMPGPCWTARSARNWPSGWKRRTWCSSAWWCNGIRQTTNSKRPITKPEDFKGLKIRTPLDAATVDTFSAMGATPAADQLRRGLSGPAERRGRRPGEPARQHLHGEVLRGAEVPHLHQPQVRGDRPRS